MRRTVAELPPAERAARAYAEAAAIAEEDVASCAAIGRHGLGLLRELAHGKGGERINVLTHCNAGWLACVDWGTALAPVYAAHEAGLPVHVYVDETRPRSQGAFLTAFELGAHGVPYTVIADNAGGHLLQQGEIDVCIVGSDRTTATGDVANKIGTYLKALAARDNGVPFYAALPFSTIDWTLDDGARQVPIEERSRARSHPRAWTRARRRPRGSRGRRARQSRAQSGVRRHARAAGHRDHHRARRDDCEQGGPGCAVSRARKALRAERMRDHREEIIAVTHALDDAGMVPNKSGNVSCRVAGRFRDHARRHSVP